MNDAAVFLTQIVDGKMQKVNLCEGCSKEKGVQDPTGFALADLLLGIGAAEEIEKGGSSTRCRCVDLLRRTSRKRAGSVGNCYVAFGGLNSLLKAMHKGISHVGKLPTRAQQTLALSDRMKTLAENLRKAVQEENYETAAALRDEIRQLENQLAESK
jgi:protein arginine kinase activator